jgi:transposase InsO family protein
MDFVCVDKDDAGKENVLVVTDHFTRYARAFVTRRQTAKEVANMLWNGFFLEFGFPRRLHSDRGACFTGKLISQLKEITGVQSSLTTPYHPQGNGQCARFNRTIMGMLGTLDDKRKSQWSNHVKYLVHANNCTANDSMGYSPFELMFGRQPHLPIDWYFDLHPDTDVKPYDQYVRG